MAQLDRKSGSDVKPLTNVLGTTPELDIDDYSAGKLYTPDTYATTQIDLYGKDPIDSTFRQMKAADGTSIVITVSAGVSITLPDDIFAESAIKLVTNNAVDDARPVGLRWKS